jgi:hypothetical protein
MKTFSEKNSLPSCGHNSYAWLCMSVVKMLFGMFQGHPSEDLWALEEARDVHGSETLNHDRRQFYFNGASLQCGFPLAWLFLRAILLLSQCHYGITEIVDREALRWLNKWIVGETIRASTRY